MTDTYPLRHAISKALDKFADSANYRFSRRGESGVGDAAVEEFGQYLLDELKALDGRVETPSPEPGIEAQHLVTECEGCRKRRLAGHPPLYVDEDGRCTVCGNKVGTFREPGEETLLACQGAMEAERSAERTAVLRLIEKVASAEHNRGGPVALLTLISNAIERGEHRYDMSTEPPSAASCADGPKTESCSDGSLVRGS